MTARVEIAAIRAGRAAKWTTPNNPATTTHASNLGDENGLASPGHTINGMTKTKTGMPKPTRIRRTFRN